MGESGIPAGMSLRQSIYRMTERICGILEHHVHSIWLYGSVVLDDFRPGWSDIDLLVLAGGPITEEQARQLVRLRQTMLESEPDNPYYRSFEGIIADISEYLAGAYNRLVYWGTSGERITDRYHPDVFSRYELARYGKCVYGQGDRSIFMLPSEKELTEAVRRHDEAIRQYAVRTDEKLYSCGWLLDIARCVYTLRYHDVISKTQAGVWALSAHVFENEEPLRQALLIRQDPLAYRDRDDVRRWLRELGPDVQRYADVLERELYLADPCGASSLSFRKTKELAVLEDISVIREDRLDPDRVPGTDEPYFKMIRRLLGLPRPELPPGYQEVRCGAGDLARHIGECYAAEVLSEEALRARALQPDFEPDLWLAVLDTGTGKIAASGIAEADASIREGTLEWIQVSPEYRRRGLGRYIVCELLRRLQSKADFVTVSGKMNSPDHPIELYRSCGFDGCVVWHVVRNGREERSTGDMADKSGDAAEQSSGNGDANEKNND